MGKKWNKQQTKVKHYKDYLEEYEKKLLPLRKKRLALASKRLKARLKSGIDISLPSAKHFNRPGTVI